MLLGEYAANIGDKNRIALPRKIQQALSGELVVTRGYEGSVLLVDKERWQGLISQVNTLPLLNMNVRDTKRFLIGGAFIVEPDAQGRFVIPEPLIQYGKLEKEIVFVGVGEWVEIWSLPIWQSKINQLAAESADIADRLVNSSQK